MGKFDGILICTDLDGTLLRRNKSVSEENLKAIEYFKSEGGLFTFVTGRVPDIVYEIYNSVKPNIPFGCINGGGIFDGEKNEYIWKMGADESIINLVETVDINIPDAAILVHTFDKTYFCKENDITEWYIKIVKPTYYSKHYREVNEEVAKVVFGFNNEEICIKLEKILKDHPSADKFDFVRSEKRLYEVLPKGSGKGRSIEKLAEIYSIKNTVAIGDFYNDIPMFESAKVAVAVSNACDEAKRRADYVTVSNEEDAIAQVIYDIENGKIGFDGNEDKNV